MKDALKIWTIAGNLLVSIFYFSHQVGATDPGVCFMVTSSGKTISLTKICGPQTIQSNLPDPSPVKHSASRVAQISTSVKYLDPNTVRIPIKRHIGRTPVIDVRFNNKQTFEMVLDTGADGTLITRKMANQLKLKLTGTIEAQIADGSEVKFFTGKVKTITVGRIVAKNIEVAIAPKADIGLLGHDFFGNYDIRLLEKEVEFRRR
jgi:predicted aspartyl protease